MSVPKPVSGFVTTTSTKPALCDGVTQVIVVLSTTVTLVALLPPNVTVAPLTNPVPVTVAEVPPLAGPEVGLTAVTVGEEIDELDEDGVEEPDELGGGPPEELDDEDDMKHPFQQSVCDIPSADTAAKLPRELPSRPTFAETRAV